MSNWTTERARVASLSRSRSTDDPELLKARHNLKAARDEEYVAQIVSKAPELTAAQRDTLIAAFVGFTAGGDR